MTGLNSTNARFGRRHRAPKLAGTTAMAAALACMLASERAQAQAVEACGAVADDGSVQCTGAGNPYRRGIAYETSVDAEGRPIGLMVSLDADVAVRPGEARPIPAAVDLTGYGDAAVTLRAAEGSSVRTRGLQQAGIQILTEGGHIDIVAPRIVTHGLGSDGIFARSTAGSDISIEASAVRTRGDQSWGIYAQAANGGDVSIVASGTVRTDGHASTAIGGSSPLGSVRIEAGDVRTLGTGSDGLAARGQSVSALISGTVRTEGDISHGVWLRGTTGDAAVVLDGRIRTFGHGSNGVDIHGEAGASLTGSGEIRVDGDLASGAIVSSTQGDAAIDLARVIATGASSQGASASSTYGDAWVRLDEARANGAFSTAVAALSTYGNASAVVTGNARVDGEFGTAVMTIAPDGLARAEVQDAVATGNSATAIVALGSAVEVTVNGTATSRGDAIEGSYAGAVVAVGIAGAAGTGGNVLVTNNGRIAARGDNNAGLVILADDSAAIGGAGSFVTHGANSAAIMTRALNAIAIDIGEVRTTGDASIGIEAVSLGGGAVSIGVEALETWGAGSTGIHVQTAGDIDLQADWILTGGDQAIGALLATSGDDAAIRASLGEVWTSGTRSYGVSLAGGQALDATVAADRIVTAGDLSSGVHIVRNIGGTGNYDITLGSFTSFGANSHGVALVTDDTGRATIRAGRPEVHGPGSIGIYASAANLDLDLTVGSAQADGAGSVGIYASGANVALHSTGTIASTGENGFGIAVQAQQDAHLTIAGDVIATGARSTAVAVENLSSDSVTTVEMTGNIVTSGYFGYGFSAGGNGSLVARLNNVSSLLSDEGPLAGFAIITTLIGDIDLTVNDVMVEGYAINSTTIHSRTGNASIAVTGLYQTQMAGGIFVRAAGLASVSVNDMEIAGDFAPSIVVDGADAYVGISGTINDYVLPMGGDSAVHVFAGGGSFPGIASVENDGSVNTFADTRSAVFVHATGTASLTGAGSVHTRGLSAAGVTMTAETGEVRLRQSEIVTEGAFSNGASLTGSDADVLVDLERVATSDLFSDGVHISSKGRVAANIGSIETGGAQSAGLWITTSGEIDADLGSVTTTGNRATGLWLVADGGIDVAAGRISTAGDQAAAIRASTSGDLAIVAGNLATQGAQSHGVFGSAGGDAMLHLGTVAASGANADAIRLTVAGAAEIEVAQDGSIWGANDAFALSTGEGVTLVNHGAIAAGLGAAIRASGGAATIWNGGGIDGSILLTDAGDHVVNAGVMRLTAVQLGAGNDRLENDSDLVLAGDLDFGDGDDILVNRGTLSLTASGDAGIGLRALAPAPVARSIAGLNGFTNSGVIDLRSGAAGDTLAISGSFAGSGDSAAALDVRFGGTPAADRLTIAGAATGSTRIVINPLDAPTAFQSGIVLVSAGAGTQPDAFRLDTPSGPGFFATGLAFDAGAGSVRLVTAPSAAAYRLLKVSEGARSAWLDSNETIAAHLASGQGGGFWMAAGGNVSRRDQTRRFDSFGFSQAVDLGYQQDSFSTQFGYGAGGGALTLGVTAGYGNSSLTFDGSADRAQYDAWNGGAYAALRTGRFHASAIAKYDHYAIDLSLPSLDGKAETSGSAFGARIEAGMRLGSARFHAEPRVSLSYQRVAIDPLALSALTRFDAWDGGRGTAGLRIASLHPARRATMKLYAEADYVKALGETAALSFTTGTVTVDAKDGRFPDYGAGKLGFEVAGRRASGFIEATIRYGGDYRGAGARAGMRIAF
ncbi:hypothetical protein OK349_04545 [Sphingomonas sp. BT-65]|uniref:hypothetical protein n=1 Tax=Sphingomonas sp. BT-65 TaxID=2989821 RepID=UPI0022354C4E|nr:hypothetical protein [Sphingomonas sp. BT-65]MCW4460965.1 hypothetical protein [Sphingomonas sp. BT-65]